MANGDPTGKSPARLRRVKRLKRLIVTTVLILIFVPFALCIYFGCETYSLKQELNKAKEELNYYLELQSESDFYMAELSEVDLDIESPEKEVVKKKAETVTLSKDAVKDLSLSEEELYDGYRKVYLTFDDGPSPNTDDILDVLKEYDVRATFFVVRRDGRNYERMYQRIVDEGHSLGLHSCTHVYRDLYASYDSFVSDTNELRNFLYMVTGVESDIYRFPGGSSNRVSPTDMKIFARALSDEGIVFFDWNVSSQDATSIKATKDQIVNNVTSKILQYDEVIILFHDLDSKDTTVAALPEIIEYIQSLDNTVILPITRDTDAIQHLAYNENNS